VLGDNRDDSRDSRDWGTVPVELIRGKVLLVYWSVEPPPELTDSATPSNPLRILWGNASGSYSRTRWDRTFHIIR
jgi:signal peptidase I